jgi:hypothetical protein
LEKIHFDNPDKRGYDCDNMMYCYTCSYIYKYASEIHYLLKKHPLTSFSEFNILSLGCGSCADLFGIDNFLTEQQRTTSVKYKGVDYNERWETTHEKIKEIFPVYNISFEYSDVFDFLENISNDFSPPNILILQYLLNELIKCNDTARINEFVEKLVYEVINKMPDDSVIILNDINLDIEKDGVDKKVRTWFSKFHLEIIEYKIASCLTYRFTGPTKVPKPPETVLHANDSLLFSIPQIITDNYKITTSSARGNCSSFQAIIRIKTK